ncbi:zinc-dependent peptidase [Methylophaga sp. OBS4]|uniref:M90 family metallopeptidase n=1 Tax=Methylophaga sp. OBS4 TaxID=2991935 RepID=UPI00225C2FC5|nr:M90 family metallopeptidase [Methylophaga sp. OBS4]MCX4186268.1 zinc-dependent peptidase [Methylophaga sp. OBS4]
MNRLQRYLTQRTLRRHAIPFHSWHQVTKQLPLIQARTVRERARLRLLTTLFLHKKSFSGTHGLNITLEMKITIAAQACIEILYLGLDSFDGWVEVIVYPGPFLVRRNVTDASGVVHAEAHGLSGESWSQGPLILSWQDVQRDSYQLHPGHHVVLHEFAHKLDMQSGRANGMPPLHPDMPLSQWTDALSLAWTALHNRIAQQQTAYIDIYAATDPAEFFAVICEYFFTAPAVLQQYCPDVYRQLTAYFRQAPPHID